MGGGDEANARRHQKAVKESSFGLCNEDGRVTNTYFVVKEEKASTTKVIPEAVR